MDFLQMVKYADRDSYICKARFKLLNYWAQRAIYFGAPASDRRLRIYDKALEQKQEGHWLRVEMQMRNKNAVSFLLNWFRIKDIGRCYSGVLRDFLRFTVAPPKDNHYDRCKICPWWDSFLGQLGSCPQLYIDGGVYSLWHVQRFLERQAASSLKLWLEANNGDWDDIVAMVEGATLNARQRHLLDRIEESGKGVGIVV